MQTLLRHIPTRQYFQSLERWTTYRDEAHDFKLVARALRFAHESGIPDLELVVSFDPAEQVPGIPLARFCHARGHNGKARLRAHRV